MAFFAPRYARAFSSVVRSSQLDAGTARQQLRDFAGTFAGSWELREFLMDPSVIMEQKLKVIDAIGARIGMFAQVRNFVAVITSHDRLGELAEILAEYDAVADEQSGVAEVEITSAHALQPEERRTLEAEAVKLAGGKIRTTYHEDVALLGGAVVRIGSKVYDGSVRAQLERMKQKLASA